MFKFDIHNGDKKDSFYRHGRLFSVFYIAVLSGNLKKKLKNIFPSFISAIILNVLHF